MSGLESDGDGGMGPSLGRRLVRRRVGDGGCCQAAGLELSRWSAASLDTWIAIRDGTRFLAAQNGERNKLAFYHSVQATCSNKFMLLPQQKDRFLYIDIGDRWGQFHQKLNADLKFITNKSFGLFTRFRFKQEAVWIPSF